MTKSNDGPWESPTEFDDDARMDADDHPTVAATAEQIEYGRALSARPDGTPPPVKRTTAQGLTAVQPRTPATGIAVDEVVTANFERADNDDDLDPASTARGLPVADARMPAANGSGAMARATDSSGSIARAANSSGSMAPLTESDGRVAHVREGRSGPTLSGLDGRGVRLPSTAADRSGGIVASIVDADANRSGATSTTDRSAGIAAKAARLASALSGLPPDDNNFDPASTARGMPAQGRGPGPIGDDVILLDRVAGSTPAAGSPRTESAAGGIVVVAAGADGERVRRLCHAHSLLVPIMSSLSIAPGSLSVVFGEPSPPAPDRVLQVVRPTISDAQVVDLLRALVTGRVLVERPTQPPDPDPRAKEFANRIARMHDRAAIETTMIEALTVLVDADRAYCHFFESTTGALWSEGHRRTLGDNSRAMGGLVGWAAYTGQTIVASPAGDDARFLLELDDPDGKPQSRIVVQPIIGGDLRVHAVLVAVRRWRNAAFTDESLRMVADLAALCAPALDLVASSGPRAPKFRATSTIPGPLAAAAQVATPASTTGGTVAARESAVIDARSKRPSSRPPPVTARPPTNPSHVPPPPRGFSNRVPTKPPPAPTPPRGIADSAVAPVARPDTGPSPVAAALSGVSPVVAPRPETGPAPVVATSAGDSRPMRAPTVQPPSTSNTGRTRAPTGERGPSQSAPLRASTGELATSQPNPTDDSAASLRASARSSQAPLPARPFHQVAIVAVDEEHDRLQRVVKTCSVDAAIVTATNLAPADARIITFGQAWSPSMDPRVIYVARDTIGNDALADLISAASCGRVLGAPAQLTKPTNPNDARRAQQAFTGSRMFASASSLAAAETSAVTTLRELLDADRAYFLYYDDEDGSLRSAVRAKDDRRAIAGIAGWVARTGRTATAERATADPRWLGPIDDPDGDPNSQLLVEPVIVGDRVRAVLVAARRPRRPGFGDGDREVIARFAALLAPLVDQLVLHAEPTAVPPPPVPSPARNKRATEQAMDDLREALPRWQRLPTWAYALGGIAVLGVIAMIASC